ncbi:MAG: hypothetical protein LH629_14080 [Ignavibacteria bacterium]|nr:hypothetical protein [Ignavibacteria bacterium]
MKVNTLVEDCDCHSDIGFDEDCRDGYNCKHCQCNEVNKPMKIYGIFKNFWEGDGYLIKELQQPAHLSLNKAKDYAHSLIDGWNKGLKEKFNQQKQRLKEEKEKGWYSTERLQEEKYATLLYLGEEISEEQENDGHYGHPPIFTIEEIEVLD